MNPTSPIDCLGSDFVNNYLNNPRWARPYRYCPGLLNKATGKKETGEHWEQFLKEMRQGVKVGNGTSEYFFSHNQYLCHGYL
jgi:hypothetical protein